MKDWTPVTWTLPKWAADLITETLDAESPAFDKELREDIASALNNITVTQRTG
jgi:hypothetical protein